MFYAFIFEPYPKIYLRILNAITHQSKANSSQSSNDIRFFNHNVIQIIL